MSRDHLRQTSYRYKGVSRQYSSSLWILDLECKWHLSPAGSFKGSQGSKEVL